MFNIGSNFKLNSRIYLDSRQIEESLEALQSKTDVLYPPGFEVYCKAEKKWYQNTADEGATPTWEERPSGTATGGGNANIDDNNIGTDVTYSNYKIETRLSEVNAEVTNVADDLIDMDTRVSYLEGKQLEGAEVDLSEYQKIVDDTLTTTNKTVPGAINEINEIMLISEEQEGDITVGDIPTGGSDDAKDILITDEGGYFESTNVEGVLQEVGQSIQILSTPVIEQIIEPEELDMPKVFLYGDALPTSKTDVLVTMDYISNTDKFSAYLKIKCQGTSSMSYAKKNFTIKMYSDEERATKLKKDFKGWGEQNQFCLKANYVDTTHTRNLSGARIGYDIVASRPDSEFKQQLLTAPRYGLVDGFPIKLYFNGEFYGIYTWNIPKGDWQFNMDEDNPNHCVLCAEVNTDGTYAENSCNFRALWGGNSNWSVEVGTASTEIIASFDRCINFVMTSTDDEFKANIGEYFDLYSLLDYYCFSYFVCHIDGLAKNMLMATYDGVIWGASLYDMDSIYGANWQGTAYYSTSYQCPEQYQEQFSLLWERIEANFGAELYARYLELRQGALSLSNIIKHVEEIYDVIPDRVFTDEKAKWTSLPGVSTNTMTRFRNYMRDRAVYVDAEMLEIGTKIPCTSITLDQTSVELTADNTTVTLVATVEPSDTTDTITWSSSAISVATVSNGLVTAISNGSAVITVSCGTQSATCNVTVSGMSESSGDAEETKSITVTSGYGFNTSTGEYQAGSDTEYGASEEYIQLVIGNTYSFSGEDGFTWLTILGYNSDKTFSKTISTGYGTTNKSYIYIADCEYVRVGIKSSSVVTITCVFSGDAVTEEGLLCYYDSANLTTDINIWIDKTGNGRNLTITNNSSSSLDITDQGLLLYGVGCRTSELNIPLTGNFTVEYELTRVNTISSIASYSFNSAVNSSCKYCDSIDKDTYRVNGYNTDTTTDLILTINQMYKIRVIYGDEITLYADDVLIGTYTRNAFTADGSYQLCLGSSSSTLTSSFNGRIKSFKLYDGIVEPTTDEDTSIYTLESEFTGDGTSTYIDTGIQLMSDEYIEKDWTMLVDFTPNTIPTDNGTNWIPIVHCMYETNSYPGISFDIGYANRLRTMIPNNYLQYAYDGTTGTISSGVRTQFVVTKSGNTFTVYDKTMTQTGINTLGAITTFNQNMLLMAYQATDGTKGRFNDGTLHRFALVEGVVSTEECQAWINEAPSSGDNEDITYTLSGETVFNGTSDYIDTGITLMSANNVGKDWTILYDVTPYVITNEVSIAHCMHEESPYNGLNIAIKSSKYQTTLPNNSVKSIDAVENVERKFAITKSGNTFTIYDEAGSAIGTNTPDTINTVDEHLLLGCYQDSSATYGRYFNGVIHRFEIREGVMTAGEIATWCGDAEPIDANLVFQVDSTSMNTTDNILTDNIAGISATLVGNPTVSDNQIVFADTNTFSFDISSLNLTSSNRTLRIKFTPTTSDANARNIIGLGSSTTSWNNITSAYVKSVGMLIQHSTSAISNVTVGTTSGGSGDNKLSTTPVMGQEYEIVISENSGGVIRWYIDGVLVQDGSCTLFDPLYLSNTEGSNRFIGSYSLIEIYDVYCSNYSEFANMNVITGGNDSE